MAEPGGSGTIEQRQFERIVAEMNIRYYPVEEAYFQQLEGEAAYKDTHIEKLADLPRPSTYLVGVTENISRGGMSLVTEKPLPLGSHVVLDMTVPNLPRPLRAIGRVMRSQEQGGGGTVDNTAMVYRTGLKLVAINKEDMKRIENYILEANLKGRM
jgi:c-di-GMP-binding flagellar brake protein YcgR